MAKGQRYVIVDGYTYDLLQQAVGEGKAHSLADAILHGISSYLGIRYKSKQERKLEEETVRVLELGKKATKEDKNE